MEISIDCKIYDLPELFRNELYLLVKRVTEICHNHKIKYFIDGGTLLGCVREQNQIPYDYDVDFGMFQEDYDKLKKHYSFFEKEYDYHLKEADVGFLKIISKQTCLTRDTTYCFPTLDILVYKNFNGIIAIKDRGTRHLYSKYRFLESNLLPLKKEYIYRDLLLYGANNPIPYLERCYDDWKKRIHDMKVLYKNEIES